MADTSILVRDYTSVNNPGLSFRLEILYRTDDIYDYTDDTPTVIGTLKFAVGQIDGDTYFLKQVSSEDEARAQAVIRDNPILVGPDSHIIENLKYFCDNALTNWEETLSNSRVVSQRYYKAANSRQLMVVSYVGDIAVDYVNSRLFYTISEPDNDNPAGLSIDSNILYDLKQLRQHHITLYSMTDYIPEEIDIPIIDPGQGSADTEEVTLTLPDTMTKTFVVDATTYVVRVTFNKIESVGSTTVTYKTDYGYTDYTTNRSTKTVTFVEEEYVDAKTYLEAYANQEIELLKQFLAGNTLSPDLRVAGEDYVSYPNPQSDKNIAIKSTDQTKVSSFYVPLVPFMDTSDYIRVSQIPHQLNSDTCIYDGTTKIPQWSVYQSSQIEIDGDLASTEAGPHYAVLTLKPGYCWEDGTIVPRSVVWNVKKLPLTVPTVTRLSFVYNTEEQGPTISSYDTNLITVIHDKETDVGSYNLTFSVIPTKAHNYEWNTNPVIQWEITPKPIDRPTAPKIAIPYNRREQTLQLTGFNPDLMDITGNKGTMTGPYTTEISLKDPYNYCWSTKVEDDDISPHTISWTIVIAEVPEIAADTISFVYNPDIEHQITISNISGDIQEALIEQIGTDTAIEAGVYTARYHLQDPEQSTWISSNASEDNTIEVRWIIEQATPKYTVSQTSLNFDRTGTPITVTVNSDSGGNLSILGLDRRVCTAQVRGNQIVVTPTGIGEDYIEVQIGSTKNYTAVIFEISVKSDYIPPLSTLDPVQISTVLKKVDISDIPWSVGDYFPIKLEGTVGDISLSANYRAVLIGIEHNKEREGKARLHFAIAQDSSGVDIAFCDHGYLSAITGGQTSFAHNTTNRSNTGGWKDSYLRDILDAFYECLPEELQELLDGTNKLTDNKAGGTSLPSSVMPIRDKVWTLSEYELFGEISYSNPEEGNCQEYYPYFLEHLTRHQHDMTGRVISYWTRSPAAGDPDTFISVSNNAPGVQSSFVSLGVIPCFTLSDGKPVTLLDSVPWSRISQLMSEGRISEIAELGDTKKIDTNRRATLISLNHNTVYEGAGLSHWIIDKDSDDKPTAMIDYNYDVTSTEEPYQQHQVTKSTNIGGWAGSHLRDVLTDIYNELPTDLKNSIVPCKKYTDNAGSYNVPENVTITRDYLFLLSEFEVFGQRTLANSKEQDYQRQYEYFQEHDPIYYSSLLSDNKVSVWLRSPDIRNMTNYGVIDTSGHITTKDSLTSLGIIPGFTLGAATSSNLLEDMTWGQISSLAASDSLRNFAQIGDTKQIHMDGNIGAAQISQTFLAVLISLDHNTETEGPNRAHFAILRDLQNREIALSDNAQISVGGLKTFSHNIRGNSNTGGWKLSNLRDICTDIYNSLDDDLRTSIVLQPKYTNNYGGSPDDLSQIIVSKTEDYVWIPSAKELGASLSYQEGHSQQTYDYFTNHREHVANTTGDPIDCWTRTPTEETTSAFVYLSKTGSVNSTTIRAAKYSLGLIPCFCVGMKASQISLEDMTWQEIQYYVQNNLLSRLVKPGATKTIRLVGNIGEQSYTGTYKAVLLDINHNPEIEGELSAHFALCFSYNEDPIVFTDANYETEIGTFRHQTTKTNAGGYSTSKLRDVFSDFYELFPSELKAVVRAIPKRTNNNSTGTSKATDIVVTETKDKVWTLSQIERTDETRDGQQSYSYFYHYLRSRNFRRHDSQDIATYWLRNPAETQNDTYYYMAGKGAATLSRLADYSLGILPCFAVL